MAFRRLVGEANFGPAVEAGADLMENLMSMEVALRETPDLHRSALGPASRLK